MLFTFGFIFNWGCLDSPYKFHIILLLQCVLEAATWGVYKKAVPKNFVIFTEKHLFWSLFLIKLKSEGLQLY